MKEQAGCKVIFTSSSLTFPSTLRADKKKLDHVFGWKLLLPLRYSKAITSTELMHCSYEKDTFHSANQTCSFVPGELNIKCQALKEREQKDM
jgi:hypothetical protein